jgi:hypothetical protein
MSQPDNRDRVLTMAVLGAGALLITLRSVVPARGMTDIGSVALLDAAFSVALLGVVLAIGAGAGLALLERFSLTGLTSLERLCFGIPLGLGVLAYLELALGLAGVMTSLSTGLVLLAVGVLCRDGIAAAADSSIRLLLQVPQQWKSLANAKKALVVASTIVILASTLQALTPVWDYDALMYHMEGPRLFLQAHRIFPSTSRWYINYPFAMEMLFASGMALGSEAFPKLLHLSMACLLVLATFACATRLFGPKVAWFTPVILLGMPVLPVWSRMAGVDFGWATFEFLSLYAVLLWRENRSRRFLVLAGSYLGLAMGTKYLAIPDAAVLGALILWSDPKRGLRQIGRNLLAFALPAALIASPWYAKNWLWLGDPLFPFLGGGKQHDPERFATLVANARTCRGGLGLLDCLLVPLRLYTWPARFDEVLLSPPSLLFPLALSLPLVRRPRAVNCLAAFIGLRYACLLATPFATRYLLTTYPALAMITSYAITYLWEHGPSLRLLRQFLGALMAGTMLASILFQGALLLYTHPVGVVLGSESREEFLRRMIPTFSAIAFAASRLPADTRLLTTGDGRAYYCSDMCLDTDDQFLWWTLIKNSETAEDFETSLRELGATHILVSWRDLDFFTSPDNPYQQIAPAIEFLEHDVLETCGQELYADENAAIYALDCLGSQTASEAAG